MNLISPIISSTHLLTDYLFTFCSYILLIRLLMQFSYINYFNPIAQIIVKFTNYAITPWFKILRFKNSNLQIINATVLSLFLLLTIEVFIKKALLSLNFSWGIAEYKVLPLLILTMIINRLFYAISFATLIAVLTSWFNNINPHLELFSQIIQPLCKPFRKILPSMTIDLSPMLMLLTFSILNRAIIDLIYQLMQML